MKTKTKTKTKTKKAQTLGGILKSVKFDRILVNAKKNTEHWRGCAYETSRGFIEEARSKHGTDGWWDLTDMGEGESLFLGESAADDCQDGIPLTSEVNIRKDGKIEVVGHDVVLTLLKKPQPVAVRKRR